MSISYLRTTAHGGEHAELHLAIMKVLTTFAFPLVRFRGLDLIARNIRRLLNAADSMTVTALLDDSYFAYPTFDSYWGAHILRGLAYEPALARLFARLSDRPFAFIDCGANYGFWSIVLSSSLFGSHECVAVEASKETYQVLQLNSSLNADRFQCLQRAVWSSSNVTVDFMEGGRHAGRHVAVPDVAEHPVNTHRLLTPKEFPIEVTTVTIADLAALLGDTSLLVKIDIEGSELHAFDGGDLIANRDVVFVYEDHGADRSHSVTRALMARGYRISYPLADGTVTQITQSTQLTRIKSHVRVGYDFIASRGEGPLSTAVIAS